MEDHFEVTFEFPDPAKAPKHAVYKFINEKPVSILLIWVDLVELRGGWVGRSYQNAIIEKINQQDPESILPEPPQKPRSYAVAEEKQHKPLSGDVLKPDFESVKDKNNPFYKKKVVITGVFDEFSRTELAEILKTFGADVDSGLSKTTNFLIKGHDPGPAKIAKANKMIKQGLEMTILNESELIHNLNNLNYEF